MHAHGLKRSAARRAESTLSQRASNVNLMLQSESASVATCGQGLESVVGGAVERGRACLRRRAHRHPLALLGT